MQYQCLRECWLDRLYAEGERVGPEAAARWPEHFAPVQEHANNTEAENKDTKVKGPQPSPQAGPALADGTPLDGLRRWELRRLARQRHPGRDIPWGRTKDMAAALARLERNLAQTGHSTETSEETQ